MLKNVIYMGYRNDYEGLGMMTCTILPVVVVMIGYIVLVINTGIDKGFPTDFWKWAVTIGIFIAIPFAYAFSIILPLIYGAAGLAVEAIVENNDIKNPLAIIGLCVLFDILATGIVFLLYLWFGTGGDDSAEPLHIRWEHF